MLHPEPRRIINLFRSDDRLRGPVRFTDRSISIGSWRIRLSAVYHRIPASERVVFGHYTIEKASTFEGRPLPWQDYIATSGREAYREISRWVDAATTLCHDDTRSGECSCTHGRV